MTWKTFLNTFVILLIIFNNGILYGQKYRVLYSMQFKEDSTVANYTRKEMLLDIDNNTSKFYSYKLYKSDSTQFSNEKSGRESLTRSMDYNFMTIKRKNHKQLSKFYKHMIDIYEMKEPEPDFQWKISNNVKMISNNKCQKASLNYKGRKWEAWFAIDIPISEGPYIFYGLPGLIVYMTDASGSYNFELIELKKNEQNIYITTRISPIPINLKQLHKLYLDNYNDPYKEIKSGQIKMKFVDESGKEIIPNFNELTKNKQVQLKKNNNPIELSDAIKYPD